MWKIPVFILAVIGSLVTAALIVATLTNPWPDLTRAYTSVGSIVFGAGTLGLWLILLLVDEIPKPPRGPSTDRDLDDWHRP